MTNPLTVLEGCAYTVLQTLPTASVDCIITSPPYWGLRDYGIPPTDWPACSYIPMPGLEPIAVPAETSCLGLEPTLNAFLAHLVLIFTECRRVLKPTGSAWVNMGDGYNGSGQSGGTKVSEEKGQLSYRGAIGKGSIACPGLKPKDLIGQPWRVAFALQAAGWYLRQDNIWHKPNPMPESIRDRATIL
jgi:DNA modification methylase